MPKLTFTKNSRGLLAAVLSSALLCPSLGLATESSPKALETQVYKPAYTLSGNYLAAYIAGLSQDTAAAAAFYRAALREDPKNSELKERAFISFLANGDMAESFRLAERLLADDRGHNLAHLALGIRDFHEGSFSAARKEFSSGLKQRNPDLGATLLTAWTWAAEGNVGKALATAAQFKGQPATNLFRDYHAGLIAFVGGKPDEAERFLKSAYEGNSRTLRIVEAYGSVLSQRGNRDLAIAVFENYQKTAPSHPTVKWALDQLRNDKVLPPLITKPDEGVAEVLYSLGAAGNVQGDELAAVLYLQLALYLNPAHEMAKIALAESYERIERTEQSVQILQTIPKNSQLYNQVSIQVAYGLEQIDKADEASKRLAILAADNPRDGEIALASGSILRARASREKDPEKAKALYLEAAENYTRALDLLAENGRTNWSILFLRGTSYERAKKWDKGEADLKKALSLLPDDQPQGRAQVMNYLAYSWVDMNKNIDEAFKLLQQAVELSPRDGMIIDSLGWAYYRLGRYEDAVRELERAVAYKPGDPTINDHLGDAYWKVGRQLDARFQWNHARDSNPEPEELKKILDKIENGLK